MGSLPTNDIEQLTRLGTEELWHGSLSKATEAYQFAFQKAQQFGDHHILQVCALNLGAVYVACRYPQAAIDILQRAIPSKPVKGKHDSPDRELYFNIGNAYEQLQNDKQAVKYFELALEEYQLNDSDLDMEATVGCKLGVLYLKLGNPLQAARGYGIAATAYSKDVKTQHQQVQTLCKQATALLKAQRLEDALRAADDSIILCQRVNQSDTLARLYSELGLIYMQCREFAKAATCFELALPLIDGPKTDQRLQAVILQNLGAIYNSLADYQRSLGFHEAAASLYAQLGNRNLQGQCFINLAFAYSQLEATDEAGDGYLHALQAARDTKDLRCQWQALEGLGTVCFNQRKLGQAVRNFKEALAKLAASRERNNAAQERIVGKLTKVLEFQLEKRTGQDPKNIKAPSQKNGQQNSDRINIFVNDEPRPPTRKEQRNMDRLKTERVERLKVLGTNRMHSDFEKIALGVGEYDSDSDLSVRRRSSKRMKRLYQRHNSMPSSEHYTEDVYGRGGGLRHRQSQPLLRSKTLGSGRERRRKMVQGTDSAESTDEHSEGFIPSARNLKRMNSQLKTRLNALPNEGEDTTDRSDVMQAQAYQEHLQQREEEDEMDTGSDSSSQSESETETESEDSPRDREGVKKTEPSDRNGHLIPPPLPEHSPPATLINTYEKAVPTPGEPAAPNDAQLLTNNFFRNANHDADQPGTSNSYKIRAPDENDPTYMTIRSLKTQPREDQPGSDSSESPPTPPPLRKSQHQFEELSRAEQEAILFQHHKKQDQVRDLHEQQEQAAQDAQLPTKSKRTSKTSSRMCLLM